MAKNMTTENILRKRFVHQERVVGRLMAKYSRKYGHNWTRYSLTPAESQTFLIALHKQQVAIHAIVEMSNN